MLWRNEVSLECRPSTFTWSDVLIGPNFWVSLLLRPASNSKKSCWDFILFYDLSLVSHDLILSDIRTISHCMKCKVASFKVPVFGVCTREANMWYWASSFLGLPPTGCHRLLKKVPFKALNSYKPDSIRWRKTCHFLNKDYSRRFYYLYSDKFKASCERQKPTCNLTHVIS